MYQSDAVLAVSSALASGANSFPKILGECSKGDWLPEQKETGSKGVLSKDLRRERPVEDMVPIVSGHEKITGL